MATSIEQGVILSCLGRIRARLWLTRLIERLAIALIWAATLALFVTGSRIVHDRWLSLAVLIAAVPIAAAAWIWFKADRLANSGAATSWGITATFIRINALLTALISILVIVDAFQPLTSALPIWAYPIAALIPFLIAASASVRPATPDKVAIFVDQQVGLKERVSTALEFFQTQPASEWEAAFRAPVISSAINACQTVRVAKVGYRRVDSRVYPLAATMAIAAAAICFVPPMHALGRPNHQPYPGVIVRGNKMLEKLKELENDPKIANDPNAKKQLKEFQNIALDMKQGNMSPFDAENRLASAMQAIKDQQDKAEEAAAMEESFNKGFPEMSRAGDDMRSATVNGSKGDANASQQKQNAESKIDKAAGEMADKLKGMSQKDRDALADKLDAAAKKAGDTAAGDALKKAAEAARKGNSDDFAKSMADATKDMAEQSGQSSAQSQANQAMGDIARASQMGSSGADQQNNSGSQSANQNGNQSSGGSSAQNQAGNPTESQSGSQSGDQSASNNQQPNGGNQSQSGDQSGNSGDQMANNQSGNGDQSGSPGQQDASGSKGNSGSEGEQSAQGNGSKEGSGSSMASKGNGDGNQGSNGSTNMDAPSGPGSNDETGHINKTPQTFVRIYDEKKTDTSGKTEQLRGSINPMGVPSSTTDRKIVPGKGDSVIPYDEVLPAIRKKALDDIETQQIPPQYKDVVREFYQPPAKTN